MPILAFLVPFASIVNFVDYYCILYYTSSTYDSKYV